MDSHLTAAANRVAQRMGISITPETIEAIVAAIMQILTACRQNRSRLAEMVRNLSIGQRAAVIVRSRNFCSDEGCDNELRGRGQLLGKAILAEAASMEDGDIASTVDEAFDYEAL